MIKLPTKQIYLLMIIIVGIMALSIYSTYAIFTFEDQTSNVVSIHTPNTLKISEDIYEYRQITVNKNSYITTDIDIYNPNDYDLCYQIWYQIIGNNIDESLVKLYQNTSNNQLSSGVIEGIHSTRVNIIITNDNESDIKINLGISSDKNEGTCSLNINEDKKIITTFISSYQELTEKIINSEDNINHDEGYLTYQKTKEPLTILNDKIYIANNFTYKNEIFTLTNPTLIDTKDIEKYQSTDTRKYYTCLNQDNCRFLYKINTTTKETILDETTNTNKDIYKIIAYDKLSGYLKGTSGLKNNIVNNRKNYLYYGDNPNNFIYYNCEDSNNLDSCELWRIIGLTYDQEENKYLTKIIRNDSIGAFQYNNNDSNLWNDSELLKYLTKEYKINNYEYLQEINYYQESIKDFNTNIMNLNYLDSLVKSKFQIMSLSDYLQASSCNNQEINQYNEECLNNNWLNNNEIYWTMTAKIEEPTTSDDNHEIDKDSELKKNNKIISVSSKIEALETTTKLEVKPVVYLKPRILVISGDGTINNPYVIK